MPDKAQASAGAVEFIDYHKPGLTGGDYEIIVTQTVSTTDQKIQTDAATFTTSRKFTVASERFALKPADVHSVFPPEGNLGEHSNVLPHIILNRSTLPWERRAEAATPGAEEQPSDLPWLALLLFDETEKPEPRLAQLALDTQTQEPLIMTVEQSTAAGKFPRLVLESGQHVGDLLTVIDVQKSRLEAIMPTADELPFLAHVRMGNDPKEEQTGEELAMIISNRLPQVNRSSTAHLVSIEGRFKKGFGSYEFDYQDAGDDDLIRLVSLKSWRFTCDDPQKTFTEILLNLNARGAPPGTLRLPAGADVTGDGLAEKFLAKGYVLLPHDLRQGKQTASWYHGPLVPCATKASEITMPVRTADELVRYDPDIGMFDVSYAAAWELGRLLSLQNKSFSNSLFQWKRLHAQQLAQTEQSVTHLPYAKTGSVKPPPLPDALSSWFESLRRLEGLPFNYLVPDERMLPVESIRFFQLDDVWVGCLLDGAFSIGRVTTSDHERDQSHGTDSPAANSSAPVAGFLLRSEAVRGWPGLEVNAYSDQQGSTSLTCLRMARLAPNVLICLFAGEMKRVEIHEKPETLHFGLDKHTSGFAKSLRDPTSGGQQISAEPLSVDRPFWRTDAEGTLNVGKLAQAIKQQLAKSQLSPPFTPAQFALQMVEGVEKVVFLAQPQ